MNIVPNNLFNLGTPQSNNTDNQAELNLVDSNQKTLNKLKENYENDNRVESKYDNRVQELTDEIGVLQSSLKYHKMN